MKRPWLDHSLQNVDWTLRELEAVKAENSLIDYVALTWDVIEPDQPFRMTWSAGCICEHLEAVTRGEIRRLLINIPPGLGKALEVETPVLTTAGWKRHGDLDRGDFVFGPDGYPRKVIGVTPWFSQPSYRLTFDDGVSVIAGEEHEWTVDRDHGRTPRKRESVTVQTSDLRSGSRPDSIDVAQPPVFPARRLLIDPYLLGAWLGDGSSDSGSVYAAEQDAHAFVGLGEIRSTTPGGGTRSQDFHRILVDGLQTKLRVLGLLGNKHIPADYLEASIDQRWALLQGLMDTDGSSTTDGHCEFSSSRKVLAEQVHRLAHSLGMKARLSSRYSTVNGVRYGPHYRVSFVAPCNGKVFRLERKQARVRTSPNVRTRRRYLKLAEPIGPRVLNCIEVEGSLYLAGHGLLTTHNSLFTSVFWPSWEWGPASKPGIRTLSASYSEKLSLRDNMRCRRLINSPIYQKFWGDRFTVTSDQWAKMKFENDRTGFKECTSIGGVGTGARGNRFTIDDPNSVQNVESDVIRNGANHWLAEVVPTRLNNRKKDAIVVIQQRTHEGDCSGMLLEGDVRYEHLILPMRFNKVYSCYTSVKREGVEPERVRRVKDIGDPIPRWDPDPDGVELYPQDRRTKELELLAPEIVDQEDLDELIAELGVMGGSYAVSAQLDQTPVPRHGGMFHRDDFHIVDSAPDCPWVCRGWDLAATSRKKNPQAAYTAGVKLGMTLDQRIVVLDVVRGQWGDYDVEKELLGCATRDGIPCPQDIPQDPGQAGVSQRSALARKLIGFQSYFSPETGEKTDRARPFSAQAEAGNVLVVRAPWNDAFIAEACAFPGKFMDQVDATSRALSRLIVLHQAGGHEFAPPELFQGVR